MKKKIKIALIILLIPILALLFWIFVEFIHFKVLKYDKPIVELDRLFCSENWMSCYDEDGNFTQIYYGIGFSIRLTYHLNDREYNKYSARAYDYTIIKREFYPFNYDY